MSKANQLPGSSRRPPFGKIAFIAGRIVFGLVFAAAGAAKLSGSPMMVAEFGQLGLGLWFLYFTGTLEIAGALLLIRRSTTFYGAGLLMAVSLGAMIAQFTVLHQDVVHTIVFAVALGCIAIAARHPDRSDVRSGAVAGAR